METLHLDACSPQSREQAIDEAARLLKEGQRGRVRRQN